MEEYESKVHYKIVSLSGGLMSNLLTIFLQVKEELWGGWVRWLKPGIFLVFAGGVFVHYL
jgi:hypothetical protein